MRPDEIALVAALCRARAGLKIAERAYLIESRLEPLARAAGFAGPSEMLTAVRARADPALDWRVVEAMTASETRFFRDKPVFEAFEADIWPRLARARAGAPVKVWSAACSTGQEVYSLAILADHARRGGSEARLDLAASDISAGAIARAKSGLYTQFEVQRGLPIRLLVRHFDKAGDMWRLSADVRRQVRWRRINLIAGLGGVGRFDVIFCRNVLGAMDAGVQKLVLEQLASLLPPDGCLVLGEGEAATAADAFHPIGGLPGLFRLNPEFRAAAA